jgi:hypothetical protein
MGQGGLCALLSVNCLIHSFFFMLLSLSLSLSLHALITIIHRRPRPTTSTPQHSTASPK